MRVFSSNFEGLSGNAGFSYLSDDQPVAASRSASRTPTTLRAAVSPRRSMRSGRTSARTPGSAKMPEEEVRKIEIAYPQPFAAPPRLEALVCVGSWRQWARTPRPG
jgi:hypothetical protein